MIVVKYLKLYLILILVSYVDLKENVLQFLPTLPIGQVWVYYREIHNCDPSANNKIQLNYYFSKTSDNTVELKGNFTCNVWFDDSFSYKIDIAVKDKIGRWQDNFMFFTGNEACTKFNKILRTKNETNIPFLGIKCPIPPGVYVRQRCNISNLKNVIGVTKFFYGSYKLRLQLIDKEERAHGCLHILFDMLRPWEKPN